MLGASYLRDQQHGAGASGAGFGLPSSYGVGVVMGAGMVELMEEMLAAVKELQPVTADAVARRLSARLAGRTSGEVVPTVLEKRLVEARLHELVASYQLVEVRYQLPEKEWRSLYFSRDTAVELYDDVVREE